MKKQKDGRYKSKVVVGERADGTKIVKYISGTTKRELEERRQEVLRKFRDGAAAEDRAVLATEWIYQYFDTVMAPNQKPQTAHDIRAQIGKYIEPALQDKQLRAVSYLDLQDILNGTAGKGHTLVSNVQSVLKRAFAAAYAEGYIPRDPSASLDVRLPPRRSNRAFTDEEILTIKKDLSQRRTEPLLMGLLFYTGMRRGEVIGLQWKHVDLKHDEIHVRQDYDYRTLALDTPKTRNSVRDIPIVPALKEILMEHPGVGDAFVVHATDPSKPLCEATFKRRWAKVQKLLGNDVTTRTFRKNFATVMFDAHVDVVTAYRAMGHASLETMIKYYVDLEKSRRVQRGSEDVKGAFE